MRPSEFAAQAIAEFLRRQKIATMPELMAALGTDARRTVFRKLKELAYRTSYSHRGRYYTLDEIAQFDELGLWSYREVWFSLYGTLLSTAAALVEDAEYGYFVEELDNVLHVGTKDALRTLIRDARLTRERVAGRFLYCAADAGRRRQQMLARRALLAQPEVAGPLPEAGIMPDELRAAIVLFFSLLDEKQRRLYAGLEALKTGWGGDTRMADLLGLDPGTVARGRRELLARDVEVQRVRRAGGGRKPVEKNAGSDRHDRGVSREIPPAQHDVGRLALTGKPVPDQDSVVAAIRKDQVLPVRCQARRVIEQQGSARPSEIDSGEEKVGFLARPEPP